MSIEILYAKDVQSDALKGKTVAVLGFGSQGHAHALNLKDSGIHVVVGLPPQSQSRSKAEKQGLKVFSIEDAVRQAQVVMMLLPDEVSAGVFSDQIGPNLQPDSYFGVAHGFNLHFQKITPPDNVHVFMVAPKGPGHTVRRKYVEQSGVPCLIASLNPDNEKAKELALSYAHHIGGTRVGVFQTTFKEETETDLFGEQAVLCGGVSQLVKAGYETLVEAGYSPVMAYFECLHELKLITDLIYEGGLKDMHYSISNTAEFGDYTSGPKVIDARVKENMQKVLKDVQSGAFAQSWLDEVASGSKNFLARRQKEAEHPIEIIGEQIRKQMHFSDKEKVVQ